MSRKESVPPVPKTGTLGDHVSRCVRRYLADLGPCAGNGDLYALVMNEAERPLLVEIMHSCEGNQSRAAQLLGINRATLRKKLQTHGLV